MKKSAFLALAASLFAHYPNETTVFFTKDEQGFFSENDAINHAKSLRDKKSDEPEVLDVTREEAEAGVTDEAPAGELTKEGAEKAVEAAKETVAKATQAYQESADKLAGSPENKNFQKSEASRKSKLEEANLALADAEAALAAFD